MIIYGKISDAESDFFSTVNSRFKIVKITSLDDFSDFSNNPHKKEKEIIEGKKKDIENKINEKRKLESKISGLEIDLKQTYSKISQTAKMVKRYYGQWKEKKQEELEDLNDEKCNLEENIKDKKQKLIGFDMEIKKLYREKSEAENGLKEDIKTVRLLVEDKNIKNKLKGARGERHVIETIKKNFEKEKDYHLINAFNINLVGEAIRYDDKIQTENKIDHILICPKGVFIIETKHWKTTNEKWNETVINQVEKAKVIFSKKFPKINEKFEFVILTAGKEIISNNDSIKSIPLENFKSFVLEREDSLEKDDIISINAKFEPYMDSRQINRLSKISIKIQDKIVKGKRFLGKLFKK